MRANGHQSAHWSLKPRRLRPWRTGLSVHVSCTYEALCFCTCLQTLKIVTDQEVNDSGLRVGQEAILFFHLDMVPSNGVKFKSVFFDAKNKTKTKTGFKLKNIYKEHTSCHTHLWWLERKWPLKGVTLLGSVTFVE